ncbi:sensor domain-containing diguanylate cyclase [Raoultella terrigena]|uniref:sensor domain-containing diguanylate cyclase n=1 Tax=Raoultella terrigena TaxID=577 RepID=UPI000F490606|nr:sensor domain-containing diguanylate cyclase [Raoultella terrigena]ROS27549.1 diguanylate cyclase (GGDEF)-like protein [Raoultella terrigena]
MPGKKLHLRTLMLMLSVGGILLTSMLLLSALTFFQKGNIENRLLENNLAYARKLADTTDRYLVTAQRELTYSAGQIKNLNDPQQLKSEAERLRLQSGFFNSVVIVNSDAVIAAASPESLKLVGIKLHSSASQQAITSKKLFISEPFISAAGNYVVFVSQPLFSPGGDYLGYIGGSIYLQKESMLSDILSMHFYENTTDVSVIDNDGKIIFNRNPARVGGEFRPTPGLQEQIINAQNGHFFGDDKSADSLVGYASLKQADWKIIISGASESVSRILMQTVVNAFWFTLAIIFLTVTTVTIFAAIISAPLEKLAEFTRAENNASTRKKLANINVWYKEAERLKEAFSQHLQIMARRVNALSDETMTDPLTGLYNRKGFSTLLKQSSHRAERCVIAIDIDHFKKINDLHGHDGGDAVLVTFGEKLRNLCADGQVACRFGGEEFVVFLPDTGLTAAAEVAERIRVEIEHADFPHAEKVTISLGVAGFSESVNDVYSVLRKADLALYEAKRAGRNAVVIADTEGFSRI